MDIEKLRKLMIACKEGSRAGIMPTKNACVILAWRFEGGMHSETVLRSSIDNDSKELFNALDNATEEMSQ